MGDRPGGEDTGHDGDGGGREQLLHLRGDLPGEQGEGLGHGRDHVVHQGLGGERLRGLGRRREGSDLLDVGAARDDVDSRQGLHSLGLGPLQISAGRGLPELPQRLFEGEEALGLRLALRWGRADGSDGPLLQGAQVGLRRQLRPGGLNFLVGECHGSRLVGLSSGARTRKNPGGTKMTGPTSDPSAER